MNEAAAVLFFCIGIPCATLMGVIGMKQAHRKREWQHRERMKAMELGISPPGANAWAGTTSIALGAVMPIAVLGIAWLAAEASHAREEAWLAAALVGGLGVWSGSKLAGKAFLVGADSNEKTRVAETNPTAKPAFNGDAYDFIAHRS